MNTSVELPIPPGSATSPSRQDLLMSWAKRLHTFSAANTRHETWYGYAYYALKLPTRIFMAVSIALPTLYPDNPGNGFAITSLLGLIFGTALDVSKAEEKKISYRHYSVLCEQMAQDIETCIAMGTSLDDGMVKKYHGRVVALMAQLPSGLD